MKQKNLILMVVAVGCGLVAAFLTTQINAKPKVEKIAVWVAKKDLAVGTILSKAEFHKLAERKEVSKDSLPPAFVVNEEELIDKRLARSVLKDETFNPGALSKGGVITLPAGFDLCSLPLNPGSAVAGFVTPGAKVDVLATLRLGNQLKAFPLLVDMLVLAVDNHTDTVSTKNGTFPSLSSVSFAATQEQALLIALSKLRGCHLELLLRHPDKPVDKDYDIKKVIAMLQDDKSSAVVKKTEGKTYDDPAESAVFPSFPAEAPLPVKKIEMAKVWVATVKIPAGTEFTREMVSQKLKEKEVPREFAVGAYSDLAPLVDQKLTLRTDLGVDQWVADTIVGPSTKAPPPEEWTAPKGLGELPKVIPQAQRKYHDTSIHTATGTIIYRYEEIRPGEWRFHSTLTPEEAASRRPRDPTQTPTPTPK